MADHHNRQNAANQRALSSSLGTNQCDSQTTQFETLHDEIMYELSAMDLYTRAFDVDGALQGSGAHEVGAKLAEIERRYSEGKSQAVRASGNYYGVCVNCGAETAFLGLQAEPETSRCLECQLQYEPSI